MSLYIVDIHGDIEGDYEIVRKYKEQEQICKEQQWIPVSKELPEENITVIGITEFDDIYKAELYNDCGEMKWFAAGNFDMPIVAWIPFPYNTESEERK